MIVLDIKTKPEGNGREHWRKVQRRAKMQRAQTAWMLGSLTRAKPKLPVVVTLTRISAGVLDTDNLASALKHVRDGVADWLGCGDGPNDPIEWRYAQERGPSLEYAVRISWEEV